MLDRRIGWTRCAGRTGAARGARRWRGGRVGWKGHGCSDWFVVGLRGVARAGQDPGEAVAPRRRRTRGARTTRATTKYMMTQILHIRVIREIRG